MSYPTAGGRTMSTKTRTRARRKPEPKTPLRVTWKGAAKDHFAPDVSETAVKAGGYKLACGDDVPAGKADMVVGGEKDVCSWCAKALAKANGTPAEQAPAEPEAAEPGAEAE